MKPVVPMILRAQEDELALWYRHLPAALKDIAILKPLDELSDAERTATEVAIVANPDPKDVASLPNLKWVQSLWAGVERLVSELPVDGPRIVRMTDPQMAETMSEAVLAWTLYLHRNMPRYARQQRERVWLEHPLKLPEERTVGILGLGKLGSQALARLRDHGFSVCGWSRTEKNFVGVETHHGADGLKTVLSKSDILVLLMPLTAETRGMIDAQALSLLPDGASLINFARGPIVDDEALLAALDSGRLDHAVLDVFVTEPLPENHPYWSHPGVTVLPHITAPTIPATASRIVAKNIGAFLDTGTLPDSVDRKRGY
ncbi:2-hydroxyacid dehydrogenase [uncultured Roseibium sp.]|uniref:2-hydroxyacid dehydrogenase n=1 Tax=uncultured Roseibium sp. TaxID=1936171 RepID=UPI00374C9BC9